jgi:hypothetical protein
MGDNSTLSWEEAVVQRIERLCGSSFGLIDDPDNIISERVLTALIERGWRVTSVTDQLELRLEYEDQIRQDPASLPERKIFIVRLPFSNVPFDIGRDADNLKLSLKLFFPHLSYNVLRNLPISWRPTIFKNQSESLSVRHPLDDAETVNFIIQDCLGLDYPSNPTFVDTLSLLADIALHKLEIPSSLQSALLSQIGDSTVLPLYDYVETPVKAIQFLQMVWQQYVEYKIHKNLGVAEALGDEVAQSVIFLDKNREFQTKVTALIAENILQPADLSEDILLPDWLHFGVHYFYDKTVALRETLDDLSKALPRLQASFNEWTEFALRWAEWMLDYHQSKQIPPEVHSTLEELINRLDENYFAWLDRQYPSLIMQPYLPVPTCVHQIPNHISSTFKPSPAHPLALVVVDGMAFQDWLIIQPELLEANPAWEIDVKGVLALVPTLTSVSRQAMLSGKLPRYFEKSWLNTNSEEMYWRSFWEEQGLNSKSIAYARGLGEQYETDASELVLESSVKEILGTPHLSVAAFIVNTIDEFVHTSMLGEREFYSRVRHWAIDNRYLRTLISSLFDKFETIIATSDHGHVAGTGIGDLSLSSVAEERALRARVFKGHVFENLADEIAEIAIWQNTGLPQDATVILPKRRGLFAKEGYSGISHGGASLEETIVPYITITK